MAILERPLIVCHQCPCSCRGCSPPVHPRSRAPPSPAVLPAPYHHPAPVLTCRKEEMPHGNTTGSSTLRPLTEASCELPFTKDVVGLEMASQPGRAAWRGLSAGHLWLDVGTWEAGGGLVLRDSTLLDPLMPAACFFFFCSFSFWLSFWKLQFKAGGLQLVAGSVVALQSRGAAFLQLLPSVRAASSSTCDTQPAGL